MIIKRFYEDYKISGHFYVDVGAHHPKRFSNTYRFYKKGWRGINIDATPGSMTLFKLWRRRDINLELGITAKHETLTFYIFNDPALNGFHQEISEAREGDRYYVVDKKEINTYPLKDVLEKHLPKNQLIDFMSIDVEGKDFEVIKSNDWQKFRPGLLLIEVLFNSYEQIQATESHQFLVSMNYSLYAKTVNTLFYKDNELI
jgi:FkbM family methyltransferase